MLLVKFTYQDYLKYEKYLERDKQKEKEELENVEKVRSKIDICVLSPMIGYYKVADVNLDADGIMEEGEKYHFENKNENYVKSYHNKHDKLFRNLLNNKQEFVDFINEFVKTEMEITADNIEKYNRSFITKNYLEKNSDIVYRVKDKNIFFLVEHQSTIDYTMPLRLLEYSYEIIRDSIDKTKIKDMKYKVPAVIPILLYTGNDKWEIPYIFRMNIAKTLLKVGIDFSHVVVDTHKYSKDELLSSNSMVGYAMQAEKCETKEELLEVIKIMLINKTKEKETIIRMMRYAFNDRIRENEIMELCEQIERGEVEKAMTTIVERLERQERKRVLKEVQKRIKQEKAKMYMVAKYMLAQGMNKEDVKKVTGLSEKDLENK